MRHHLSYFTFPPILFHFQDKRAISLQYFSSPPLTRVFKTILALCSPTKVANDFSAEPPSRVSFIRPYLVGEWLLGTDETSGILLTIVGSGLHLVHELLR